jgi:uncharacterized protein
METRRVEFRSGGLRLIGDLNLPEGPGPHRAVVVTGAFSNVKEQAPATYAEQFAVAVDHAAAWFAEHLGPSAAR